jgi:vancomycin resistance protein YoaR
VPRHSRHRTVRPRRRRSRRRPLRLRPLTTAGILAALALVVGLAFAGSEAKLASGVRIGGVDVGGLTPSAAETLLGARSKALEDVPVTFTAPGHSWRVRPKQLGVEVDWHDAVAAATREGRGFGPLRGFRRIEVRVFGADVAPPTRVYDGALQYELKRFARAIDRGHREPAVELRGLNPVVVPGKTGQKLARTAAATTIVRALAAFSRTPVALPVRVERPAVLESQLQNAAGQTRVAVSAPVRLTLGPTRWRLPRWRIAQLLSLPRDGRTTLRIGGDGADAYFVRLRKTVDRAPVDANWREGDGGRVSVAPDQPGLAVDVRKTAASIFAAATSRGARVAHVSVEKTPAKRTTAEAQALKITQRVAAYETIYGGEANRIHNVQLVAHLVDGTLIKPGGTFSFNGTTGERTAAKGFVEAPVIINGELQTGLGGGVCQVSTTVFNAAYEAGLDITARTNHALYISHYPLGRDATVNYPDLDLEFVNDTSHWMLLRTYVGSSSLVVALYGTALGRRVESETTPLREVAPPPVKRVPDPDRFVGEESLEDSGEPARATSVHRKVYDARGTLIHDNVWYSSYRSEPRIIRVGTKPRPVVTTTSTATTTAATTTTATTATTPKPAGAAGGAISRP